MGSFVQFIDKTKTLKLEILKKFLIVKTRIKIDGNITIHEIIHRSL